jgi:hypothetical protein
VSDLDLQTSGAPPYNEPTYPACGKCGNEKDWRDCYNCEDGFSSHDCGEDCCCCLHPEDNVRCDICKGKGGWYQCFTCHPWED